MWAHAATAGLAWTAAKKRATACTVPTQHDNTQHATVMSITLHALGTEQGYTAGAAD